MLRKVGNALFRKDQVGFEGNNLHAHLLDVLLLNLQNARVVLRPRHLNVGLAFTLVVLERAVQQQNTWVFNSSSHLRVGDVLVDHDTPQNPRVFQLAAGNLFDFGVALDVNLLAAVLLHLHRVHGTHGNVHSKARPLFQKLGADARLDNGSHLLLVHGVHRFGNLFVEDGQCVVECAEVGANDNGRVHLLGHKLVCNRHELARQHNNRRCAVTNLLVLCPCNLNHRLGCRVLHHDLAENGIAVAGHDNTSHGVHQHLEHGTRPQTCAHHICNRLGSQDVVQLHLASLFPLARVLDDKNLARSRRRHRHGCERV
eukprot:m.73293 g.73293  ORF g.73293 m.73293 type:complete len:313 (+) comp14334_c0_seq3:948-1886(+)